MGGAWKEIYKAKILKEQLMKLNNSFQKDREGGGGFKPETLPQGQPHSQGLSSSCPGETLGTRLSQGKYRIRFLVDQHSCSRFAYIGINEH